ncbi:RHS repeat-associated core domain-containing protein [Oceanispirochaeta crateris]|uniref:RHS repeat-associated core domain-containing protein n=1 Tax=Oceanispirochaeta crateris TaxID=2518645 RepID=A0A5C1QL15_9SPIO|nr:RHS repeat-associated core domain-containing protein [Oceanispirochaeta crateris]QEN07226.1 RHS repeat-associated core domain-containing protein [Oceanispirochaeta crateris]
MLIKLSSKDSSSSGLSTLDYNNTFSYYADAPHRVEVIANKYYRYDLNGNLEETFFFDSMWSVCGTESTDGLSQSKNIYVGETRISTKLNFPESDLGYETLNTYYYHTVHQLSSNVVTDPDGEVYEHLEYTPYGEMWVEDQTTEDLDKIPYGFTGKEWDEETNLYYMSARYQDPMTSRWISADPAGAKLVNPNSSQFILIGSINWYSYTENNPLKYLDPTGFKPVNFNTNTMQSFTGNIPNTTTPFGKEGCTFSGMSGVVDDYRAKNGLEKIDWQDKLDSDKMNDYFDDDGKLKRDKFLKDFTDDGLAVLEDTRDTGNDSSKVIDDAVKDEDNDFYLLGRGDITKGPGKGGEHEIGISGVTGSDINQIDTSDNDQYRNYTTDGQNKIDRVIKIGEKEE